MTYTYTAYGLNVQTPFPCPILPPAQADSIPDVVVVEGAVTKQLSEFTAEGPRWQARPGRFLFRGGRNAGRFLVEDGRRVTLQRNPAAVEEIVAFHFLSSVCAAVLRQRGSLVLHASSVITPAGAVALCGVSGAGKSTTLATLVALGCGMLADDVTVVRCDSEGKIVALPGVGQYHLCQDAVARLGQDNAGLTQNPWRRMKSAVPAHGVLAKAPVSLRAIYLLKRHSGCGIKVSPLAGRRSFAALQECIYGPLLPEEHPAGFSLFASLAHQTPVYMLERPEEEWTAHEVAEAILHG